MFEVPGGGPWACVSFGGPDLRGRGAGGTCNPMRTPRWNCSGLLLCLCLWGCAHAAPETAPTPAPPPGSAASERFDDLNWDRARVARDPAGVLVATLGIGVDVVGLVRVPAQGDITYEQHPVMFQLHPPPQPLLPADRASLSRSLERYLVGTPKAAEQPLWQALREALRR